MKIEIDDDELSPLEARAVRMAINALALSLQISGVGGDRAKWIEMKSAILSVRHRMQGGTDPTSVRMS